MARLSIVISAYTVYLLWFPLTSQENHIAYVLSWAGAASIMSVFDWKKGLLPLMPLSLSGLAIAVFYKPEPLWLIAAGISAGAVFPFILRAFHIIAKEPEKSGYGIASGTLCLMLLAYLIPNIPEEYLRTAVGILPLSYLLIVPLSPPIFNPLPSYKWGYLLLMFFTIGITAGIYDSVIFQELMLVGSIYNLMLLTSFSAGAFIMARHIDKKGVRMVHGSIFMTSIPISLALFGFMASETTYLLSGIFIGFGLGSALVFSLGFVMNYNNIQRALSVIASGVGFTVGSSAGPLFRDFYGIDMEGLAFIAIIVFFGGALPAVFKGKGVEEISQEFAEAGGSVRTSAENAADTAEINLKDKSETVSELCDIYGLSKREAESLALIFEGRKTKEIAEELFISESTVKTHIRHIYEKTGARNKVELMGKMKGSSSK